MAQCNAMMRLFCYFLRQSINKLGMEQFECSIDWSVKARFPFMCRVFWHVCTKCVRVWVCFVSVTFVEIVPACLHCPFHVEMWAFQMSCTVARRDFIAIDLFGFCIWCNILCVHIEKSNFQRTSYNAHPLANLIYSANCSYSSWAWALISLSLSIFFDFHFNVCEFSYWIFYLLIKTKSNVPCNQNCSLFCDYYTFCGGKSVYVFCSGFTCYLYCLKICKINESNA